MYIQDLYRKEVDFCDTQFVLSLSYGKDSMACIHVIKDVLGLPLDRIVTADVWATDTISANLPPVEEFKKKADAWILEHYGIEVEHFCAQKVRKVRAQKVTFEKVFDTPLDEGKFRGCKKGWPMTRRAWCKNLKVNVAEQIDQEKKTIHYLGIAADEPIRIDRHIGKPNVILPLVEAGWDEDLCGLWCKYSGVRSPTYTTSARDGCWFCHYQGVEQLRLLRRNYPDLWALMLKWDDDSPVSFHADGHTVRDFDRRFQMEDEGILMPGDRKFKWAMVDGKVDLQMRWF